MIAEQRKEPESIPEGDVRTQYAALCFDTSRGKTRVLLVTSRDTRRWIVPKGWPIKGATPAGSAAREAWEEAGVVGRLFDQCLGIYCYIKREDKGPDLPCAVTVYPVKVLSLKGDYPERRERRRKWFSLAKAAERVDEAELAQILRAFDPKALQPGLEA